MTCGCNKETSGGQPDCAFCCRTRVWWNRGYACYAWRCYNVEKMLTAPPEWAVGATRRATVGDVATGTILEDADYIAVRSCFCNCKRCKHFELQERLNDG